MKGGQRIFGEEEQKCLSPCTTLHHLALATRPQQYTPCPTYLEWQVPDCRAHYWQSTGLIVAHAKTKLNRPPDNWHCQGRKLKEFLKSGLFFVFFLIKQQELHLLDSEPCRHLFSCWSSVHNINNRDGADLACRQWWVSEDSLQGEKWQSFTARNAWETVTLTFAAVTSR